MQSLVQGVTQLMGRDIQELTERANYPTATSESANADETASEFALIRSHSVYVLTFVRVAALRAVNAAVYGSYPAYCCLRLDLIDQRDLGLGLARYAEIEESRSRWHFRLGCAAQVQAAGRKMWPGGDDRMAARTPNVYGNVGEPRRSPRR